MESYFYAQLDGNGVCVAVSQLSGEVNAPHMIRLTEEEYSMDLLGRRYLDGLWLEPEPVETPAQTLPPEDIISLAIADLYAQNLEVLASLNEGGAR